MKKCRSRERKKEFEINLITRGSYGLELTTMDIKKSKLNIDLMYNDDFAEVDKVICKRLNAKKDKGIVLLHGLPGTGKTTYIRNLIGRVKKKILFLPPGVAGHITDPDFVNILIENPESIVIIEDAENIIMDRSLSGDSSVSNLLNISDGLLSDFLSVQLICTFNTHISKVDSALLRKGRLIAKYEFGKLSQTKAQKLSDSLQRTVSITEPMTISEIYNQEEKSFVSDYASTRIGFRTMQPLPVN
jgi:ATP-dependent 26S proteasome regulatory subunit